MKREVQGHYGIVKVIKGNLKGMYGIYDDDECDDDKIEKAIVYIDKGRYCLIDYDDLSIDYTYKDLQKREIELFEKMIKTTNVDELIAIDEERKVIQSGVVEKTEEYIERLDPNNQKIWLLYNKLYVEDAMAIATELSEKNINVWVKSLENIENNHIKIPEDAYILLLTGLYTESSSYDENNIPEILSKKIKTDKDKIIILKKDDCELSDFMESLKCINMVDYTKGFEELYKFLSEKA